MTNPPLDQNLLNRVKVEPIERPSAFYKAIVFEILTVVIAFLSGFILHDYFSSGGSSLFTVIAFTVYLVFSALLTLWTRSLSRRTLVLIFESLAIAGFFYDLSLLSTASLGMAIFVFGFVGVYSMKRFYDNTIEFRFLSAIRPQITKMITGLIIIFVVAYPSYRPQALLPSRALMSSIFSGSAGILGMFYQGITPNSTVDDFTKTIVEVELANDARFAALAQPQKDQAIAASVQSTEANFEKTLGFPVTGGMSANDFFASIVSTKLGAYESNFGPSFILVWMIVVFFVIRSFAAVYYIVVALFAYLTYEVLIAFDVVHIASEARAHEYIEFSRNY